MPNSYEHIWSRRQSAELYRCNTCGAVVQDVELHDNWHALLDRVIEMAHPSVNIEKVVRAVLAGEEEVDA